MVKQITTYVSIATVIIVCVGFYGQENILMEVNQEYNSEGYM